jgi:argininosuccinate synthase
MKLHRGHATPVGRRSPRALYDPSLATYGAGDTFDHEAARGFIRIFGLGTRIANAREQRSSTPSVEREPAYA